MKKKLLRKITAIVLVAVLFTGISLEKNAMTVTATSNSNASSGSSASSSSSAALKEAQEAKAALEKELAEAKATIKELKESKGDIEDKVTELNQQLISISARITDLENQLTQKSQDIASAQAELVEAQAREAKQYNDMKIRIQFMYENGLTSYLEALLSSRNISEFMNSAEYIAQIESYDRQKLTEYGEIVEAIANLEAQLEQEYQELQALKTQVENDKAAVASLMREKETELAGIADDIEDAQSEADYYAAEIQAQEEIIAAIRRAEAEKIAAGIVDSPYSGGAFVWPCPSSSRITSDYGNRISPTSGASSNHKGIDVGAAYGADIVAAASGTVKVATYSSSAGNYVMIDHGGGLYTVYMHASSLTVSAGQQVSAGQVIAKVGSTGISTGNHLHFGVSLNGSYVSPWNYLSR